MVLLVPAPADFRAQKEAVLNPFSVGTEDHLSSVRVWGPLPQKCSLPLGFSEGWKAAGKVLLGHKTFELLSKGKFSSMVSEKGLFSSFEGWGTRGKKKRVSLLKNICSGFEAFSKCNWTSAAPSVTAAGDFTSTELNTFMQDLLPCT